MATTDVKSLLLATFSVATMDVSSLSPEDIRMTVLASTLILEPFQMSRVG